MVEWARSGARYTRDFDDLTAWLAQQMSQTQVTRLMRIAWETVGNILERVVGELLDPGRLDGLELIGVETVSSYCTSGNEFLRPWLDSGGVGDAVAAGGLDLVVDGDRELALADAPRL
jgi:Helix-turn-helix domain of transposase family ISL3